jgi:type VI secretion system protein ImpD
LGGVHGGADFLQEFLQEESLAEALRLWQGPDFIARHAAAIERIKAALDRDIARIDALLTEQVGEILKAEEFRALEATWRGVHYLTQLIEKGDKVKCLILNISWPEVARDFERASDFDQSTLFELIYSQEFGIAGGEPFGLLVGDYFISHRDLNPRYRTDDVNALRSMAATAAAAFSPFVCSCDPDTLGLANFEALSTELDLEEVFRQPPYQRWRALRELEDARFIGICVPRVLLRRPWSDGAAESNTTFRFHRSPAGGDSGDYLWGNPAFAFAAVVIRAFVQTGWFAEIRGVRRGEQGGGLVPELPIDFFATDAPGIAVKQPVEVAVSDRQERRLSELGFIPASVTEYVPAAVFYSNQSLLRPARYTTVTANANARLSSMLQYVLCVSRFAHVVKVIGRERIASFATLAECQAAMQSWLSKYVQANPSASLEMRTKFPLREGRVTVSDSLARPGVFKLEIHLQPHLQLDDISTGIRLTSELTAPRAGT